MVTMENQTPYVGQQGNTAQDKDNGFYLGRSHLQDRPLSLQEQMTLNTHSPNYGDS